MRSRILAMAMAVLMFAACLVVPANAAEKTLGEKLKWAVYQIDYHLDYIDYGGSYGGSDQGLQELVDYKIMKLVVEDLLDEGWTWNNGPMTVPKQDYEAVLARYLVPTEDAIQRFRSYDESPLIYDPEEGTYTVHSLGGRNGENSRAYWGYQWNGSAYDVYFCKTNVEYLSDELPAGMSVREYGEEIGWPETTVYEGKRYDRMEMDGRFVGYERNIGFLDRGIRYTVELHEGNVRLISAATFDGGLPDLRSPLVKSFQEALDPVLWKYSLNEYMVLKTNLEVLKRQPPVPEDQSVTVSAAEYEAVLDLYFQATEENIRYVREKGYSQLVYSPEYDMWVGKNYVVYDAEADTYTISYLALDVPELSIPAGEYVGYVKNGEAYHIYYRDIDHRSLQSFLPEGKWEEDYAESKGDPDVLYYNGKEFVRTESGYYHIDILDSGVKFTVEYRDGTVRILSRQEFSPEEMPRKFDDKFEKDKVTVQLPQNGEIVIPDGSVFEEGTVLKAEALDQGDVFQAAAEAMQKIAERFRVFEFSAALNGQAVQPGEPLTVVFAIPEEFGLEVTVYYMAPDGKLEAIETVVDAKTRTASAKLPHFSTYILADGQSKPVDWGNANGDDVVDYLDAMLVLRHAVKLITLEESVAARCDVNASGNVDYLDAMLILRRAVKLIDQFPVELDEKPDEPSPHEHSWREATCTEPKTCDVCSTTEGVALGHSYGQWCDPKMDISGQWSRSCSCMVCGDELTEQTQAPEADPKLGSAGELNGITLIVSIFAEDAKTNWDFQTERDRDTQANLRSHLEVAVEWLVDQAKAYDVNSKFVYDWEECPDLYYSFDFGQANMVRKDGGGYWSQAEYIKNNIPTQTLLKKYNAQNVIYMFYFNTDESNTVPSCAFGDISGVQTEIINIFARKRAGKIVINSEASTFAHEIMHCFGAYDLYYASEEIPQAYVDYLEDTISYDIMFWGASGKTIRQEFSELDAYYVGLIDSCETVDIWGLAKSTHLD